ERRVDTACQKVLAPTVGESPHTGQEFRERDRGDRDITLQRREPFDHAGLRRRPKDLRDDIGVEDDHSTSAARATSSRAGIGRSSTPPTSCAADSSAIPIWGRRAALVRISRTSASIERPCSFACAASCRLTASSSPRTMMDDISDHPPLLSIMISTRWWVAPRTWLRTPGRPATPLEPTGRHAGLVSCLGSDLDYTLNRNSTTSPHVGFSGRGGLLIPENGSPGWGR